MSTRRNLAFLQATVWTERPRRIAALTEALGVSERTEQRDLAELEHVYNQGGADQIAEIQGRERMVSWQRIEDGIQALQPRIQNAS